MITTKKPLWSALLGLAVVATAWLFQRYFLAAQPLLPLPPELATEANSRAVVSSVPNPGQAAAADPQQRALEAKLATLQSSVAARPKDVKKRWALVNAYQRLGRLDAMEKELQAILKLQPNSELAIGTLATTHLAQQQFRLSEADFRRAVRRFPRSSSSWSGLAAALYHQKRYLEAMRAAQVAVRLEPREPSHSYVLGTSALEYAMQFPDPQTHREALILGRSKLMSLLSVWPDQGDLYYRIGRACIPLLDSAGAIKHLRRAKELMPQRADVYASLASVYKASGNRKAALKTIDEALAKNLQYAALYDLKGKFAQISGTPDAPQSTLEAFQKASQLAPQNAIYREQLGLAYLRLNKLDEARAEFEQAVRLNPERSFPYQQLAAIYTRAGEVEEATRYAKISTGLVFNDNQLKQIQSLSKSDSGNMNYRLILADRYRDLKLWDAARDEYLFVLHLMPKNKRATKGLATLKKLATQATSTATASAPSITTPSLTAPSTTTSPTAPTAP